jgi:hypothetical protein
MGADTCCTPAGRPYTAISRADPASDERNPATGSAATAESSGETGSGPFNPDQIAAIMKAENHLQRHNCWKGFAFTP